MQDWFKEPANLQAEPGDSEIVDGDFVLPHPKSLDVMTTRLLETLQQARAKDTQNLFEKPVLPTLRGEVKELYRNTIAKPMDFESVERKVRTHGYSSALPFFQDLLLIGRNCWTLVLVWHFFSRVEREQVPRNSDRSCAPEGQ